MHKSSTIDNFQKKIVQLQKIIGEPEDLSIGNKAYFDLSTNKTEALNIMRQIFPGSQRSIYEIPKKYGKNQMHLIRCLKLPKVLKKKESQSMRAHAAQHHFVKGIKTDTDEH